MGLDALNSNGITEKIYYLTRDRTTLTSKEPLRRVRWSRILLFVTIQLLGFGATMVITQTIGVPRLLFTCSHQNCLLSARLPAAIGFPVVISLLIPLRTIVIPRLPFTEEELAILDGPTASPFVSFPFDPGHLTRPCSRPHETMESVGGTL